MMDLLTTLLTVIGSAGFLEIIRLIVSRRAEARKSQLDSQKATSEEREQEFEIAFKIQERISAGQQAAAAEIKLLKEEIRANQLKAEATQKELEERIANSEARLTAELTEWRGKYYALLREYGFIQQQYILVSATLSNLMHWLREKGIDVPYEMPIVLEMKKDTTP